MFHFLVAALFAASQLTAPQQPRDIRTPPTGTAAISGIVVSDTPDLRPLRRARVMLNSTDRRIGRTVITDDAGSFVLPALPAGRYLLSAAKDGYVSMQYGAKGYGRQPATIVLSEGQQVSNITLKLPRGGVITGMILDHEGQPVPGVSVRAMRYMVISAERRFTLMTPAVLPTDDRGAFRIFGLPPGEYAVAASSGFERSPSVSDVRVITEADVRRAIADAAETVHVTQSTPGESTVAAARPVTEPVRTLAYAPIFYPGTAVAAQAATISVGPGEERSGIDFRFQLVPTAKVEGVVATAGTPPSHVTIRLIDRQPGISGMPVNGFRTAILDANGRFTFTGVTPGTYSVSARGIPLQNSTPASRGSSAPASEDEQLWATTEISVDGEDISELMLTLQPPLSVSGRVRFEGSTLEPPDPTRVRVSAFPAVPSPGNVNAGQPSQPDSASAFTIRGLTPGRYRFTARILGNRPDGTQWTLKSAIVEGSDTLDTPVEIRQTLEGAILTFTDRPTELSGMLADDRGRRLAEYTVIVFTADRTFWGTPSRRVQTARPASDGRYMVRGLPPGDYLIAVVPDLEPGQTSNRSFLQSMATGAMPISLAEGERKTQDITVASGSGPQQ